MTEDPTKAYAGFQGHVGRIHSTSTPAWPVRPTAPDGAPNILVMLCDDHRDHAAAKPTPSRNKPIHTARSQRMWDTSSRSLRADSMLAGVMFLPPDVMMMSFFRPVMDK